MNDDRTLLLGFLKGARAPAAALWERHAPRVRAHALAILRNATDADDVTQQVFCALLTTGKRRGAEIGDLPAYLAHATRHPCLSLLRLRRRDQGRRARAAAGWAEAFAPGTVSNDVLARLDGLSRAWREVLILKHACGLTFDQIALAVGAPRTTVASRHAAAIDALRRPEPLPLEVVR